MGLINLVVSDFRNIATAELEFSPQLNLITGGNGAGKTSLLEAIYFLGRAQSFRTTHPSSLIREGANRLLLRGQLQSTHGNLVQIGIQRDKSKLQVRLAGRPVRQLAELVSQFPFQLLNPDSHLLLEGGPRHRRRFLDWGVFHVEHAFFPTWQRYGRALRQRNAALRARKPLGEVRLWDVELVTAAISLDQQRQTYLDLLLPVLDDYIRDLVDIPKLHWDYRPGWSRQHSYAEALAEGIEADRRQGFTRLGPHRADLLPMLEGLPAQERISRGQQKQVVAALLLAQVQVYQQQKRQPGLILIDDLASELDAGHRERVLRCLQALQAQVFLTSIDPEAIDMTGWPGLRRFHVEHGQLGEVIY
ncbi:MAG: DNA replication/repair protein RecF [Gammaproteobacteria bacterium]